MDIRNTSPLVVLSGGIWDLMMGDFSQLKFSNGHVSTLSIGESTTAILSGGQINKIVSGYYGSNPSHITIDCKNHNYNTTTKLLTGIWWDNTAFSIQLVDTAGYSKTIDNINFIPEPASLLLVGLGGLFLRRK